MATCGDLTFDPTVSVGNCFNEGGYTGRFWILKWSADQFIYDADGQITGNFLSTPRMGGDTGIRAGLNVINVKNTANISEKTGTPEYGVVVNFPQGWVLNEQYQAVSNLVASGRLIIILERNGALTHNFFEVIGGESGLLVSYERDSGKKPEDFDVTMLNFVGKSGKNMSSLTYSLSGGYTGEEEIANGTD